jgi:hypothetical protein
MDLLLIAPTTWRSQSWKPVARASGSDLKYFIYKSYSASEHRVRVKSRALQKNVKFAVEAANFSL